MIYKILLIYLCVINLAAFLIYGIDKLRAKKDKWRIPEKVLILLAVFGGSLGAFLGMRVFHHKTQKWKFKIGIPLIIFLQIAALVFFIYIFLNK